MTQFGDISTAVKARLDAITNIGKVYAYQRNVVSRSGFLDMFKYGISGEDTVRGWMIRRERITASNGESFGHVARMHHMLLVGFTSIIDGDDSYADFQNLVEAVMDDLDARKDLGLAYVLDYNIEPCQLRTFGEDEVGGYLCHAAEIEFTVNTEQSVTFA